MDVTRLEKQLDVKWEEDRLYHLKGIDDPVGLRQITYDPAISYPEDHANEDCESQTNYSTSSSTDSLTSPENMVEHPSNLDVDSVDFKLDDEPMEKPLYACSGRIFLHIDPLFGNQVTV